MKRLTDKVTAAALKSNAEKLQAAGVQPSIIDLRYIKLAEYEEAEERKAKALIPCDSDDYYE